MSASTSKKNGKLYAYLKGFEHVGYTGSELSEVTHAIRELLNDEFRILLPEQNTEADTEAICRQVDKFLIRYYDRMKGTKSPEKVKKLAEDSKKDLKSLETVIGSLMGTKCPIETAAYWSKPDAEPMDICLSCPWYISDKHCLLYLREDGEADYQVLQFKVAEYKYLYLALLIIVNRLTSRHKIVMSRLVDYYSILTAVLTAGHIFELMNPIGSAREEYLEDAKNLITAPPIDYTSQKYLYYDQLLDEVFSDIREGKKPYVRHISSALKRNQSFISSKFDEDRDFYYSMKGTGQLDYTKVRYSLQSSAFETDPHKRDPRVSDFDAEIGYESYYQEDEAAWPELVFIRTLGINNPAKFKIRIIHVLDNALQDRCNWIHRRLMAVLDDIPNDSTFRQESGREFLRELTNEWFLSPRDEKIGIYCTDFSNATDTADQRFTHRVLDFVFGPEVAGFWDYMSTCPKELAHAVKSKELYRQTSGQPQGALASFPIFALCHHILFLMDMKENGLEDVKASDFYTVLGDDAVYNSVFPETEFISGEPELDESGLPRSILEMSHFDKCRIFAGFKINYDKSESAHQWSSEARLDFAKVTYRNGKLFSPIPFRLAMKYNRSFDDKLAVTIWRADRSDSMALDHLNQILTYLPENKREEYRYLIQSGEIPFLDRLSDHQDRPDEWSQRVRYALGLNLLRSGLAFTIMSDNERSHTTNFDQYRSAMKTIFTPGQELRLDNIHVNHKVMRLLEKNGEIISVLHQVLGEEEFDDQFLSLCVSSLMGDAPEEVLMLIYGIARFQRQLFNAKRNPDITVDELRLSFPQFQPFKDFKKDITNISNRLLTRGITKRPGEAAQLFRSVFNTMEELHQQLDTSFSESPNANAWLTSMLPLQGEA